MIFVLLIRCLYLFMIKTGRKEETLDLYSTQSQIKKIVGAVSFEKYLCFVYSGISLLDLKDYFCLTYIPLWTFNLRSTQKLNRTQDKSSFSIPRLILNTVIQNIRRFDCWAVKTPIFMSCYALGVSDSPVSKSETYRECYQWQNGQKAQQRCYWHNTGSHDGPE